MYKCLYFTFFLVFKQRVNKLKVMKRFHNDNHLLLYMHHAAINLNGLFMCFPINQRSEFSNLSARCCFYAQAELNEDHISD